MGKWNVSHIVPKNVVSRKWQFSRLFGFDVTPDYKQTVNYKVTRKQVTENFVNTNGTKITPPTGFTQGNKIPMTNTFKYIQPQKPCQQLIPQVARPTFQGWYKGKTKPNALTTSTTPTYNTTFDGNDDMTAMYKEEVPKASVALTRTVAETVTQRRQCHLACHNYQYKPSATNHGDHQEINRLDNRLSSTNRHDCHASWRNRKNSSRHSDYVDQWC